ncbi:MAG: type II toxin-antitoxin system prevent-host-death family antitoxin [Propioniciclava sp.]|uniref:type II toxin-antitoxin system Phd/YefM family antitoxin n=1 Tax=Propioniciclava sp. TaxID=2038686 RepID=UPI0039E5CC17
MSNVVSISEAKANLSKLVKRASTGEVIYLGAYGQAEAVLAPVPARPRIAVGVWKDRRHADFVYDADGVIGPDADLAEVFEESIDEAVPR